MEYLKNKPRRNLLIAIAVIVIIILFWAFGRLGDSDLGLSVNWKTGEVLFSGNGEIWEFADNDTLLKDGYIIRTSDDSRAILKTPKGGIVRLNENTEIKVVQLSSKQLLLTQNSGRTYHHIKMSDEGIYQVNALGHTIKAVGTAFDVATNNKADRINVKVLEGKVKVVINSNKVKDAQEIEKAKEITVDPANKDVYFLANINQDYINSEWFNWNKEEDKKLGFELNLAGESDDEKDAFVTTTSKTITSTTTQTSKTTYSDTCKPYLTAKKSYTYGGILLNWSTCSNDNFQFYKVVRSTLNRNPIYPNDSTVSSSSNRSYSSYIDKTVAPARTYYYRVCVVQKLNKITCGNVVSVTY